MARLKHSKAHHLLPITLAKQPSRQNPQNSRIPIHSTRSGNNKSSHKNFESLVDKDHEDTNNYDNIIKNQKTRKRSELVNDATFSFFKGLFDDVSSVSE